MTGGQTVGWLPIFAALTSIAWASGPDLEAARKLYNLTDFSQSLQTLQAIPQKDAAVYELMGRDYYMLAEYKKATEVLEKAVTANPGSSECALWLGRAYGRRAATATVARLCLAESSRSCRGSSMSGATNGISPSSAIG